MVRAKAQEALSALTSLLAVRPELAGAARQRWRSGGRVHAAGGTDIAAPDELIAAVDQLSASIPELTHSDAEERALGELFADPAGEILFEWCSASTWRRDTRLARLLATAKDHEAFAERVHDVVRARVVEGPLGDALACAPLLGTGEVLAKPENVEVRARLQILIWEAGASALEVPELGPWLWGSSETFEAMIHEPARAARFEAACSPPDASR